VFKSTAFYAIKKALALLLGLLERPGAFEPSHHYFHLHDIPPCYADVAAGGNKIFPPDSVELTRGLRF